jgi:hypothetical protein
VTEESTAFEWRIERIYRLLEDEDAVITWNDRIPDPDNPSQPRQIDITIRRDQSLTIVECRVHKSPQDVTWIEELIGRRESLRANAVIAVSASGFTEGARAKATHFGIILRDFQTLTAEEIRGWGKTRKVTLIFFEFTEINFEAQLPARPRTPPQLITDQDGKPLNWREIFHTLGSEAEKDGQLRHVGAAVGCTAKLHMKALWDGQPVSLIKVDTTIRHIRQEVALSSVVAYADALGDGSAQAVLGGLDLGNSEIIESADRVHIVVDLSEIAIPPRCLFRTVMFDFGRPVVMTDVTCVGVREALNFQNSGTFRIKGHPF